jgi:hypothetical protein
MNSAAAQYDIFRKQVVTEESVFTFRDAGRLLVYRVDPDGDTIPFWSSRSRLETIQSRFPKYADWQTAELGLADFWRMLDKLERDDVSVGVNWSGARLTGYNVKAADLRAGIAWWIDKLDKRSLLEKT